MPASNTEKAPDSPVSAPAIVVAQSDRTKTVRFTEHRKSSKPIMEKRRRARINESLCQLKTLILNALRKDTSRHSKLEKADILEMTVKHLKNLQQLQMSGALNTDPSVIGKFRAGFSECMNEVTRFLSTCEGVDTEIRTNLLGHLATCIGHISIVSCSTQHPTPPCAPLPPLGHPVVHFACSSSHSVVCKNDPSASFSQDLTNSYSGFQILSATDGKFAFLIPSSALVPNGPVIPRVAGAGSRDDDAPVVPLLANDSVWRPW